MGAGFSPAHSLFMAFLHALYNLVSFYVRGFVYPSSSNPFVFVIGLAVFGSLVLWFVRSIFRGV